MEVAKDPQIVDMEDATERFKLAERRLRGLELEKIDLIQAVRLSLKAIGLILTRRGYNSDLVNVIKKTETRLGAESEPQKVIDQMVESVSSLAGHDTNFVPIEEDKEEQDDQLDNHLKDVLDNLLKQLEAFKNNKYKNSSQIIKKLVHEESSLENLMPVIIDLCQRFLYDYTKEINNITNRLNTIIRMLLFLEKEYSKFLDLSINNYSQSEREFKDGLVSSLNQIQKTVKGTDFKTDADKLLNQLSLRIEGLLVAVKKKSEEDAKLLSSLTEEKESLINRLDNVRRDYDNFVSQSHKTLIEMETIKSISLRDALTQVYNRRAYDEQIGTTIENYKKGKIQTFSLIIFDIDFFREVNNNYGHLAGDSILTNVGRIVKESLRSDDFIFRYGGDEFIVLLPEAKIPDAFKVAEKLRHQLEVVEFRLSRTSETCIHISISVGVTEVNEGDTISSIFARADKALYESKTKGRNRVSSL
jgi:diguanylate cyclase (GGDEF)-like protein